MITFEIRFADQGIVSNPLLSSCLYDIVKARLSCELDACSSSWYSTAEGKTSQEKRNPKYISLPKQDRAEACKKSSEAAAPLKVTMIGIQYGQS